MWEERAERARREIAAMATSGQTLADLYTEALAVVQQTVPFEQACWAGVDPDTLVMTSVTNWRQWPVPAKEYEEYSVRFVECEYTGQEPNNFAALLRRPRPVARISDAPHREVVRSVRINDLLMPQGLEHELRAAFRVDDSCWGVGSLFREAGKDFTDRELEFLAAVAATIGAASRIAVRAAHAAPSGTARARMRDAGNSWVVLQASRLITGDDPEQMVVTVEPATTQDLVSLLLTAYGATAREREVCLEVLAGSPTAEIARHLFISPHTVHDHVKALFEKVGVGSRGELVAKLLA